MALLDIVDYVEIIIRFFGFVDEDLKIVNVPFRCCYCYFVGLFDFLHPKWMNFVFLFISFHRWNRKNSNLLGNELKHQQNQPQQQEKPKKKLFHFISFSFYFGHSLFWWFISTCFGWQTKEKKYKFAHDLYPGKWITYCFAVSHWMHTAVKIEFFCYLFFFILVWSGVSSINQSIKCKYLHSTIMTAPKWMSNQIEKIQLICEEIQFIAFFRLFVFSFFIF